MIAARKTATARSRAAAEPRSPRGRISDVQRRQMTTVDKPNIHALAIDGAFDDCQRIV